jgi:hypothetical protein
MVEGGGVLHRSGGSHVSSGVVMQAERLLGLRRMKMGGAWQSGRERGGVGSVGRRVGRWAGRLGPATIQGRRSGRAGWA